MLPHLGNPVLGEFQFGPRCFSLQEDVPGHGFAVMLEHFMSEQSGIRQFPPILMIFPQGTTQNSGPERPENQAIRNAVCTGPLHRRPDPVSSGDHKNLPIRRELRAERKTLEINFFALCPKLSAPCAVAVG
jgi:hypothetical protein